MLSEIMMMQIIILHLMITPLKTHNEVVRSARFTRDIEFVLNLSIVVRKTTCLNNIA